MYNAAMRYLQMTSGQFSCSLIFFYNLQLNGPIYNTENKINHVSCLYQVFSKSLKTLTLQPERERERDQQQPWTSPVNVSDWFQLKIHPINIYWPKQNLSNNKFSPQSKVRKATLELPYTQNKTVHTVASVS